MSSINENGLIAALQRLTRAWDDMTAEQQSIATFLVQQLELQLDALLNDVSKMPKILNAPVAKLEIPWHD